MSVQPTPEALDHYLLPPLLTPLFISLFLILLMVLTIILEYLSKNTGEELSVGGVLQSCSHNPAHLLEHLLISPVGIEVRKQDGNAVVLPDEQLVHCGQTDVFIHPHITGFETPVRDDGLLMLGLEVDIDQS